VPLATFWKGKRVFLTGHTGFKGSWLALRLVDLGASVSGFALSPEGVPNAFDLLEIDEHVESNCGDVRDADQLTKALREAKPDVVMHLAAQALVRRGYREPRETFETNVMGTVNVLEAVRTFGGVGSVLVVTSDKTYANHAIRAHREDDPLGGDEPYSASKACAEIVAGAYRQSYFSAGTLLATARAGNVIGGGDFNEDRLVPDLVRASQRSQPVILRNPNAVRPWQFVADAVDGYLRILEAMADDPAVASAWNLGPPPDAVMTVGELARTFLAIFDSQTEIVIEPSARFAESQYLALDARRARAILGWRPRYETEAAIAATADWYSAWRAREDLHALTLQQLRMAAEPEIAAG
jgi:CDP-glucose 4,6-dehydratase